MKKLYLLFILATSVINSQNFEWLQTPPISFSMNPDMIAYSTACDPGGNVYLTGFKDGAYPYTDILGNLYFNKYSSNGSLLFSKTISGKAFAYNMISDSDGSIIIALGFLDTITLDDITLTETDQNMRYVLVKFDSAGNRLWHKVLALPVNGMDLVSNLRALATDTENNVYAGYDNFSTGRIVKYSPAGIELQTIEQLNVGRITSIDVDDVGNIYAAGSCASSEMATFSGVVAPSGLQYNTYLVKYSPEGIYQWVKFVDDVTCSEAHVVAYSEDAIYYSSYLYGDYMFDTIQAEGPVQSAADFFLVKLNGNGQYQWVREVPGTGSLGPGRCNFLNVDVSGNIYLSGFTDGAINWGNGVQTPGGVRKSVLLKYNPEGNAVSAVTAAGGYGRADSVALNTSGDAFIAGMGFDHGMFGTIEYDSPQDEYYTYLTKITATSLGVAEQQIGKMTLYPNPAADHFYVSGNVEAKGSIINMLGQKIMDMRVKPNVPVSISGLPKGTYFVLLEGYGTKKLIIQ